MAKRLKSVGGSRLNVPVGTIWRNYRSGKLVTVTRRDLPVDTVTVKYSGGSTRITNAELFISRHRLRAGSMGALPAELQFSGTVRHDVKCKKFPDPYDERDPTGPCTCGAESPSSAGVKP